MRVRQRLPSKKENAQSAIFLFCMKRQSRANDAARRFPPSARTEEFSSFLTAFPSKLDPHPAFALRRGKPSPLCLWYNDTAQMVTRHNLKLMPKRGSDADRRIFFDELLSLTASRLKATGAIRLEDRHGIIAFGDETMALTPNRRRRPYVPENGGAWSYFICPRCGGRKKKLWLVEEAPRCLSCCWSLGVRYRSAYGFGRSERLRERDRYVDRVQDRRLRGRKRRLTMTMRRSMIVCRLAQLAHQQKAKDGSDEPLPFMRAYQPRKAAIEAIPDLKRLWKAQTAEALEQALDQAQTAILDALQSDDMRVRIIAASLMLKTRAARQLGWT